MPFGVNKGGFHITFDNGITVSVQIGAGMYSDNHDADILEFSKSGDCSAKSTTAELAIFYKGKGLKGWLTEEFNGDDQVSGWQTVEDVMKALIWAQNYGDDK